jgi:hypothetical protein
MNRKEKVNLLIFYTFIFIAVVCALVNIWCEDVYIDATTGILAFSCAIAIVVERLLNDTKGN